MPTFFAAFALPLVLTAYSEGASAATEATLVFDAPAAITEMNTAPRPVTAPAPPTDESQRITVANDSSPWRPPPWEFLLGVQGWDGHGNLSVGWTKGRHELRLIGPNTGLFLDYKATFARIKAVRFNAGGLVGAPALFGGHVGVLYRTGGDSFWGRVGVGLDAGVSCARDSAAMDCTPTGGWNFGVYFSPSDIEL